VLYVEYENLDADHKYLLEVTVRTDTPDGPERTEHEIESKLIVGHDIANKFDVAFNWINETNFDTGRWEFGYALGFNHALVGEANQKPRSASMRGTERASARPRGQLGPSERPSSAANSTAGSVTARSGRRSIPTRPSSTWG
jgi:hypothetical protein